MSLRPDTGDATRGPAVSATPRELVAGLATAALVVVAYSILRVDLNREFAGAPWAQLLSLDAPLPFGHRILGPLLARALVAAGASLRTAFILVELAGATLLSAALYRTFRLGMGARAAFAGTLAAFAVLPYAMLLQTAWPIYYPYDTLAQAFVAVGLCLVLEGRRWLLVALVAVAALNRESAVLPIALFVAVWAGRVRLGELARWSLGLVVAYASVRGAIRWALSDNPGEGLQFALNGVPRILNNLDWLGRGSNAGIVLAYLGFVPAFALLLRRSLPEWGGRVFVAVGGFMVTLLFVGNLYEPRIFGEAIVASLVPLVFGAHRALSDGEPAGSRPRRIGASDPDGGPGPHPPHAAAETVDDAADRS